MNIAKLSLVILAVFLLFPGDRARGDGCKLTKDLFERRSALIAAGGLYRREPTDTTAASKELEGINEWYFQFMMRVVNPESTEGGESECCSDRIEDPVAKIVCGFVKYLKTGRKDRRLFLESLPTDPIGRQALWALEPIAFFHAERDPQNIPTLFKPSGPVTLYLDELYRLVSLGGKEAVSEYLELYLDSDGEHAEQMDDQIEDLLKRHSDFVLRQWDIFKLHRKALVRFMSFLPNDEKKLLKSKIGASKECAVRFKACSELKTLLSSETPLRE
jgi:hypothetical protein